MKNDTESQEFNVRERGCPSQDSPHASFCQRLYKLFIKNKIVQGRCHHFAKTGLKRIKIRKSFIIFTTLKVKQQTLTLIFDKFAESSYEDVSNVVNITLATLLKTKLLLRQSIRHLIRMLVSVRVYQPINTRETNPSQDFLQVSNSSTVNSINNTKPKNLSKLLESHNRRLHTIAKGLDIEINLDLWRRPNNKFIPVTAAQMTELARIIEAFAELVETHWVQLKPEVRKLFMDFVYSEILGESTERTEIEQNEEPLNKTTNSKILADNFGVGEYLLKLKCKIKGFFQSLRLKIALKLIKIQGDGHSIESFYYAVRHLKNAVLNAVEEENPVYQQDVKEIMEEAVASKKNRTKLTKEQFNDWFESI